MNDPRDFVAHEAALLDERRFDEWLALFTADGHYWVPLLGAAQADPYSHNSLAYEDRLLLQLRVQRLQNPRAHSQHPASHSQHVLSAARIEREADGQAWLRTPFLYVEARGQEQTLLSGTARHHLVRTPAGWSIRAKRIDLLGAGRALPAIQLFI
ncbi:aromatic-ring-hydroxylating dioxygenase subunit beta [Verminephrobacter eiseniae]|uniref:Aromatic-ring-hydroxylating dioxygenase, beta subunit n=1 Tax=Verminephrobacter eiseniae (strain EF01-2) TaxID=391735 RepID=A1WLA4_VEREI|nr:aromatic-ring-hydroxylating dioxygenase subunit beta [Verminephrobacter eiseniae]KAB7631540.1 aromatic-ring-hydroxylating dioxygenase subunit beta [Verminephrobacter sp. Larva24]ABM58411.1 aromatic-ring-hydroxylating dioxygenase, beta subunit [Verminephrobacter eiseniae EF01-2]MCW5232144.1 aromatic-ring-hydroxylating dioxygenase subunit beta [Verminephrobacter eiseniae]MCW5262955.1 aromatic-ring-hydroxylating dioxygenase subunit beta [Verminephrobacter eiseniae]MCW5283988.1 aromatic-ring-hy